MIKAEVRSLIRNLLPKVDESNAWHDRVIDAAIEKALSSFYEDVWRINPLNLQRYVKRYGYTASIAVYQETGSGIYYSTLPEMIVPFQDKASGVRRVDSGTISNLKFFPMDAREVDLVTDGPFFDTANTKIGYLVTQDRVEFYNMSATVVSAGVRMDLIIPFSRYEEEDIVLVPEIVNPRTNETFADRVLHILGVIGQPDLKDDNTSSFVTQKDR